MQPACLCCCVNATRIFSCGFPTSSLNPQAERELTHLNNSRKRQSRTRSFTGWPMAAGMSAVRKWLQITHRPTPKNAQAAMRRGRSRTAIVLFFNTEEAKRRGCSVPDTVRSQQPSSTYTPQPALPTSPSPQHWPSPGESQTQVRT